MIQIDCRRCDGTGKVYQPLWQALLWGSFGVCILLGVYLMLIVVGSIGYQAAREDCRHEAHRGPTGPYGAQGER